MINEDMDTGRQQRRDEGGKYLKLQRIEVGRDRCDVCSAQMDLPEADSPHGVISY